MKTLSSKLLVIAMLVFSCAMTALAQTTRDGGLLGGFGGDDGPKRADGRPPPRGPAAPAPGGKPDAPANAPAPTDPKDSLDRAIERGRAEIEAQRANRPETLPAVTADQADRYIEQLRKKREERGQVVGEEDRRITEDLRRRTDAFAEQWGKREDAIRNNRRPADIDVKDWVAMRDRYRREKRELQAEQIALQARLQTPSAELRDIDRKIEYAASWAKRLRSMGASSQEVARRLHQAKIALMERRLTELQQLKDERERGVVRSANPAAADAAPSGGDWYVETMNWLSRQMALSGRSIPTQEELKNGVPLHAGLDQDAPIRTSDRVRAKLHWIDQNIARFERDLTAAEDALISADEQAMQERYEQLAIIDRTDDPQLTDSKKATKRQESLDRLRKEQETTRPDRLAREQARLNRELETWRTHHQTETTSLASAQREEAEKAAAATRPAASQPGR